MEACTQVFLNTGTLSILTELVIPDEVAPWFGMGTFLIASIMQPGGGEGASQMRVSQQDLDQLQELANPYTPMVLPTKLTDFKDILDTFELDNRSGVLPPEDRGRRLDSNSAERRLSLESGSGDDAPSKLASSRARGLP